MKELFKIRKTDQETSAFSRGIDETLLMEISPKGNMESFLSTATKTQMFPIVSHDILRQFDSVFPKLKNYLLEASSE